jgi:hypothetical protein
MANKNGFIVNILVNNNLNKITQNNNLFETYLYNESKYIIKITNLNSKIVDAYLKIDGKKMGAYRIIPNETIDITRPFRRRKDLYFLNKKKEYSDLNLFSKNNKNLGCINITFMTGELYPKEDTNNYDYTYNKQVYRLSNYEYNPKFMNIYKRPKNNLKILKEKKSENEIELSKKCCVPQPQLPEQESEPESEPESCYKPELESCYKPELESCCPPGAAPESCYKPEPESYNEECSPCSKIKSTKYDNDILNDSELGFTTYGNYNLLKYKIYQALNYDGNSTLIKIYLYSKLKYEALN